MRMHCFTRLLIGLLIGLFSTLSMASGTLCNTGYTTAPEIPLYIVLAPKQTLEGLPAEIADRKAPSFSKYKIGLIHLPSARYATSDDSLLRYRTRYAAGSGNGDFERYWKPEYG